MFLLVLLELVLCECTLLRKHTHSTFELQDKSEGVRRRLIGTNKYSFDHILHGVEMLQPHHLIQGAECNNLPNNVGELNLPNAGHYCHSLVTLLPISCRRLDTSTLAKTIIVMTYLRGVSMSLIMDTGYIFLKSLLRHQLKA